MLVPATRASLLLAEIVLSLHVAARLSVLLLLLFRRMSHLQEEQEEEELQRVCVCVCVFGRVVVIGL